MNRLHRIPKNGLGKKVRALVLMAVLMLGLLPTVVPLITYADSSASVIDLSDNTTASGTNWTYSGGVFTVTGDVTITGTTTTNHVFVASGTVANITLDSANIDISKTAGYCAFDMTGATVNLTLSGENVLKSGNSRAGLQVPSGSVLTINAATGTSDKLTASGGNSAAGIGGGSNAFFVSTGGDITINSGTVTANGGSYGAGIGGGGAGAGGNITVNDGTITANGGSEGAGIGGGGSGGGGNITISGGTITANSGTGVGGGYTGAGIGGGSGSSGGGTIVITGGNVSATGGSSTNNVGAGIGGGGRVLSYVGNSGYITITSNATIIATGGASTNEGGGAGIGSGGSGNNNAIGVINSIIIENGSSVTATGGIGEGESFNGANIGYGGGRNTNAGQSVTPGITVTYQTVTVTQATGGTIAPFPNASATTVVSGANQTYKIIPIAGYKIAAVEVDGVNVGAVPSVTIPNITDDTHTITATFTQVYGISLSQTEPHTFPSVTYGYTSQPNLTVTVDNPYTGATGPLTVALSGPNAGDYFTLTDAAIGNLTTGASATFFVTPKTGLAVGTHTATVIVSGANGISESFGVSLTVGLGTQQALTLNGLGSTYTYGDDSFKLSTSGGSGDGAVTYASSDASVASVSGDTVTLHKAGTFTITATKAGDSSYSAATTTVTATVSEATPNVNLTASGGAVFGDDITLTATVSPVGTGAVPSGTVTFKDGNMILGTGVLDATGIATFTDLSPSVGSHNYTVTYPGETDFYKANSASCSHGVGLGIQQVLTLNGLGTTYTYGDNTFNLSTSGGSGNGAVTYASSDNTVASVSGDTVTLHKAGTFTITATKSADSSYSAATATGTATVTEATPNVNLTASGGAVLGDNITLTATVSPVGTGAVPSGTVTFKDGNTVLGTGTLDATGIATFTNFLPSVGDHSYTVTYHGETDRYKANSASCSHGVGLGIQQVLTLNGLGTTYTYGDNTFSLSTSGGSGNGAVTYASSDASVAGVSGDTVTLHKVGTFKITATKAADSSYSAATATGTATVTEATPNVNLTASGGAVLGDNITLTATVSPVGTGMMPSGTLTFKDGNILLGTGTLDATGIATFTDLSPSVGTHSYTVTYPGETDFYKANSASCSHGVGLGIQQVLTLNGLGTTYIYGDNTFSLSTSGGSGNGAVTYASSDSTVASISGDTVTLHKAGTFKITATKAADSSYSTATATGTATVNEATPNVNLTASGGAVLGDNITLIATVSPVGTGMMPSGTLTFKDGNIVLGTGTLDATGIATFTDLSPSVGTHSYTVTYLGETDFYKANSASSSHGIGLADQATLIITDPGEKTYGDGSFSLSYSGGTGAGAVTYSVPADNGVLQVTPDGAVTIVGAGTVTVTATKAGADSYNAVENMLELTVNPRDIANTTVTVLGSPHIYAGSQLQPTFDVTDGTLVINSGDYTSNYGENVIAGTAGGSITLIGQGNYTGTKMTTFDISPAVVDLATISGVIAPVRGAVPVTMGIETDQYTGTVTWMPTVSDTFVASTVYTATITLTAKPNYTLTGVCADFFTIVGSTTTNQADSGVVTAVFPETDALPLPIVYSVLEHFGEFTGSGTASARVDAGYTKFIRLLYGGVEITPDNYTITQGSTIITLKEDHLKTYANGTHWFVAEFSDGTSENIKLTVNVLAPSSPQILLPPKAQTPEPEATPDKQNQSLPKTGEASHMSLWMMWLLVMIGATLMSLSGARWIRKR